MGVASLDLQQTDAGQGKIDYGNIVNKPMINGVTLEGDLSTEDINIFIPQRVSELQNDAGYITKNVSDLVFYYDKTEVDNMISTIPKFDIKVVDALPTEDISPTTIYLLMVTGEDHFEEYIYVDDEWDKLGDGNIDLSDYATYEYVDAELAEKVDAADLATVALSGRYSDLIGAPVNLSQFTNDVGYLTEVPDGSVSRAKLSSALNADLTAVENAVEGLQNSVRGLSDTKADKTTVSALSDTVALKADKSELPTKTSDLTNDSGFITSADVPTNVSELTNDSGYITSAALTSYSTTQQMNTAISTAVADKADRSEIPTKVSDLTNDSGFVNSTQVNTALAAYTYPSQDLYTQSDIDTMLAQISSLKIEVVNTLPQTGNADTIYLLRVRQQGNDLYQEYFWVNNAWELIGGIDLTDYYTKTEVNTLLTAKADVSAIPTKTSDLTNDSNFAVDANYVHTDNNYTTAEKNKLAGVAAGAEVNVQSNWTQTNSSADDFIKNKPSIPTKTSDLTNDSGFITTAAIPTNVSAFNNDAGYLDEIPDDSVGLNQLDSTIVNALNNINNKANTADLASVAFSGDYDDLINQPAVPTKTSDLTNDSGFVSDADYASANDAGVIKVGSGLSIDANGVLSSSGLASVDWTDITNKPTNVSYWTNDAGYITSAALPTKTSDLTNDSGFITSASVPTKTSDLTNDSGFITSSVNNLANYYKKTETYTQSEVNSLLNAIVVPTKTSDLQNDGSDGTAAYLETDETAYKTASIPYGQCDSTSTATVFTATVPGVTELRDGVCMWLKNGVVTSAANFTININNLGAKPVYSNMAAATRETTLWNVNYTMFFVYDSTRVDGGCWILYRGYNSDNNTIGYQLRTNSQSLPMSSVVYRYRLLFTSADGTHYVPANNSTSTNATSSRTVCQEKINPFGSIFYYSATASVAANTRPAATALWEQFAIALGYSFNRTGAALTLTSWKPVYIKAAPQSDGSAIIDSTTPYVQDLPTTEDGKIYIFLGIAYSATNIELQLDHPVYWFKDGMIRPYTNASAGGISSVEWGDITGTLSSQTDLNTALGAKANSADLATVATSGLYNDLANKPTIPTVNNATLTIQKNSTNVATFTANAASNVTANISVPTATSDLMNDSGFITSITKITNAEIDAIMGVA